MIGSEPTSPARAALETFGHATQRHQLGALAAGMKVPHALLFSGPRSTGKRHIALHLACLLFQRSNELQAASARSLMLAGNHPDLHFIAPEEGKKDISVESVRELRAAFRLRPYLGTLRIAIINDAHLMNVSASNALLMTLEEPPPGTCIILVTDTPHRLLETIISRCQPVNFGALSQDEIRLILTSIAPSLAPKVLEQCLSLAVGSLEPLALESYINPLTSHVTDPERLKEHLVQIAVETAETASRLKQLFSASRAKALVLASEFAANDTPRSFWHVLRSTLRQRMSQDDRYADVLLESLLTEQRIRERNLSPPIQLSELFLRIAEVS